MGGRGSSSGKRDNPGFIDRRKYKEPVTYAATAPYNTDVVPDSNGRYSDKQGNRYSIKEVGAENKKGYLAVRKAEEGSMIVVHYPEYEFRDGIMKAHDEYYEMARRDTSHKLDMPIKKLQLHYKGSSLPHNETIQPRGFYILGADKTSDVARHFRRSDRITIYAPKIKARPFKEQEAEWRAEFRADREKRIAEAKAKGIKVYGED